MSIPAGWYDDGSGSRRWWDGNAWTESVDPPNPGRPDPASGGERQKRKLRPAAAVAIVLGSVLLLAGGVTGAAFATAERWTKVDVPERPGTFHTEEYETGDFVVVDDGVSPCYVGQDWYECRNSMVDEHNRECLGRSLTDASVVVCDSYAAEIDRMEVGEGEWMVEDVGEYGRLQSHPQTVQRQVSNNDARSAQTHEAVCYFGFLGECR